MDRAFKNTRNGHSPGTANHLLIELRLVVLKVVLICLSVLTSTAWSADLGNRLNYLDESDPYYVHVNSPKLVTPQWVGGDGVEAVVILGIDDMRGHEKWEAYLRPILERLKNIDGRAPVSIMTCQIDPQEPHLQTWLAEGLSLEIHTIDHPMPLLGKGDFAAAKSTYDRCVDLLSAVPNNRPVAFRMPYCDSLNSVSPRFYAEIFNARTTSGKFLAVDTSVFQLFTGDDQEIPRDWMVDSNGKDRFSKYLPQDRTFVNYVENYPYPFVINRLCWEFPCMVPSDWSAQHLNQPYNPQTVEDLKLAIDVVALKQGTLNFVFHPHGWIRPEQVNELIDHALDKHQGKVLFLTFKEALERLDQNLLAGNSLRDAQGNDQGVRLLDLNLDGFMDVIIANERTRLTRVWSAKDRGWTEFPFPGLISTRSRQGSSASPLGRFGVVGDDHAVVYWTRTDSEHGAWKFADNQWIAAPEFLTGLVLDGAPLMSTKNGQDTGMRFRDVDGDGGCEVVYGGHDRSAVFAWNSTKKTWENTNSSLPQGTALVDQAGQDAGLRFVDVNEDGHADVLFSNETGFSLDLYDPATNAWTSRVREGRQGDAESIPPISLRGENNGAFFKSSTLWYQNEQTDRLTDLVDRRAFAKLLSTEKRESPLSPEDALQSMNVRPGMTVELVAAEPLVMDPVAIAWGADGKLWVVEMADYPLGIDGAGQHGSRVRFLEDLDNDGKYDRSTTFLDGLNYANGVLPWRDGILVTCAPEIFYAEDTNGDGKADVRRPLYRGFTEGNQQHRINGLRWGLDNWVYCANGDSGGRIESVATGESVDSAGRDLRFHPDTGRMEAQSGLSQFGRERDDWGNWFGNNNSNPLYHYVLDDHYLRRNPHVAAPSVRVTVPKIPGAAPVYPASVTPPRFNDLNAANRFTSACSSMIYRDDVLGSDFAGNVFVCEPVHNLVHREIVSPLGDTFTSQRAPDESQSEFLASQDNWFRPVMVRTGPDGAIWIVDMYRQVIEHPEWIPKDWQAQLDLRAGHDRGRIYKVYPQGAQVRSIPSFAGMPVRKLVQQLDVTNGWQRDMVQQLLVERKDLSAVDPLIRFLKEATRPTTRLHAFCTLDGLDALTADLVAAALQDEHPGIRRHAIRLSERFAKSNPSLADQLLKLVSDPDPQVRLQLACSLGELEASAGTALATLALADPGDDRLQAAIQSSLTVDNLPVMAQALFEGQLPPPGIITSLLQLAIQMEETKGQTLLLNRILRSKEEVPPSWKMETAAGLMRSLRQSRQSLVGFLEKLGGDWPNRDAEFRSLAGHAQKIAADDTGPSELRSIAMELLGAMDDQREADIQVLGALLAPQVPAQIQDKAAAILAEIDDPRVPGTLLRGWSGQGPAFRSSVLEILLKREAWTKTLLDHVRQRQVLVSEIDAVYRQALLSHANDSVRELAEKLFAAAISKDRRQVVERYAAALSQQGDHQQGSAVFKKHCSACHRLGEVGHPVGPDLGALSDRSLQSLLVAIFDPNRAVESKYLSYTATTTNGLTFTGIVKEETGNQVRLLAADGKETIIPRADIDEFASNSKSLMPEGMEKDLAPEQVTDLVAFLRSQRLPHKVFAGNQPEVVRPEALRGELWLLASQAEIYGPTLVMEPQFSNLGFWGSEGDHAIWSIDLDEPGEFSVWLDYACDQQVAGNGYAIEIGGTELTGTIESTGTWEAYRQVRCGKVALTAGQHRLIVRPLGPPNGYLMDLHSVRMRPGNE